MVIKYQYNVDIFLGLQKLYISLENFNNKKILIQFKIHAIYFQKY